MAATDTVVVHQARTPFEAQIVAGLLRQAGIPAQIEGSNALDEFTMSQRMMNLDSIEVRVPTDYLEEARERIEAAREAGRSEGL